ncbi:MAG: hypothetical protein P1P78_08450 [Methyloprofundus sp.]|nr:hypothetical protein [Methyloprofundus sp.]
MSSKHELSQPELGELEIAHRQASDKRFADRIKTVYLLGKGWTTSNERRAGLNARSRGHSVLKGNKPLSLRYSRKHRAVIYANI